MINTFSDLKCLNATFPLEVISVVQKVVLKIVLKVVLKVFLDVVFDYVLDVVLYVITVFDDDVLDVTVAV